MLVFIYVIYLWLVVRIRNKSLCHQPMYGMWFSPQLNKQVTKKVVGFHNPWLPSRSDALYSSQIWYLVSSLVSRYVFPVFHNFPPVMSINTTIHNYTQFHAGCKGCYEKISHSMPCVKGGLEKNFALFIQGLTCRKMQKKKKKIGFSVWTKLRKSSGGVWNWSLGCLP